MSTRYETRSDHYTVAPCPRCNQSHIYTLEVRYEPPIPLFGGPGDPPQQSKEWDVVFECPETHKFFPCSVPVPPKGQEKIIGVIPVTYSVPSPTPDPSLSQNGLDDELKEWTKASAQIARDFSKTMITVAIGAIPLFFSVLAYLGAGADKGKIPLTPVLAWIGFVPPCVFFISSVIYMLALRPQYAIVFNVEDFRSYRTNRLREMNRYILIGTGLFVFGVLLAIISFVQVILG